MLSPLHSFSVFIAVNRAEDTSYSSWYPDRNLDSINITILLDQDVSCLHYFSLILIFSFSFSFSLYLVSYFTDLILILRRNPLLKLKRKSTDSKLKSCLVKNVCILGNINTTLLFVHSWTVSGAWHSVRHSEQYKSNEICSPYPSIASSLKKKIRYNGQP